MTERSCLFAQRADRAGTGDDVGNRCRGERLLDQPNGVVELAVYRAKGGAVGLEPERTMLNPARTALSRATAFRMKIPPLKASQRMSLTPGLGPVVVRAADRL